MGFGGLTRSWPVCAFIDETDPIYLLAHKNRVRSLAQDLGLFIVHDHDRGADVCQPIADFFGRPATTLALVVDGDKLLPCKGAKVKDQVCQIDLVRVASIFTVQPPTG